MNNLQVLTDPKATKLVARPTIQGLVGVLINGNFDAMAKVNCVTDFIAKDLPKCVFDSEKNLKTGDDKSFANHLALLSDTVAENASFKRAICFKVNNDFNFSAYALPQTKSQDSKQNVAQVGKYGWISCNNVVEELNKNLSQQIFRMNPKKVNEAI